MRNLIFLPTIQSTGTWFCIELIRKHSMLDYFTVMSELAMHRLANGSSLVHAHFGMTEFGWGDEYDNKFLPIEDIKKWIRNSDKVVVPLRDPLLSLVTGAHRLFNMKAIVDGFVAIAGPLFDAKIFFVPIDLYTPRDHSIKLALLIRLFNYLGLKYEGYIKEFADNWPIINTMNSYPVKEAYFSRDLATVSKSMPKAYDYLCSHKAVLRPFLETVGYSELMWW